MHPILRHHAIKVAFFNEQGEHTVKEIIVQKQGTTVFEFNDLDLKQFKAVMLNFNDHDFVQVQLDNQSLQYFLHHLTEVKDNLSRILLYRILYNMVKEGNLHAGKLVDLLLDSIQKETEINTLLIVLGNILILLGTWVPR
jgi:aminopeptidase N